MTRQKQTKSPKSNTKVATPIVAGAISVAAATGTGGYILGTSTAQNTQEFKPDYSVSQQDVKTAKTKLSSLEVRSDTTNIPDYNSKNMPDWTKNSNGCKTRYNTLVDEIPDEKTDEASCKLISGTLFDYYTGTLVKYNNLVDGGGIDIDHIVAKGDAWESGGYAWDNSEWKNYINDRAVLKATSASINRSKGDKNAAEWLPPNEDYWCKYVIGQINIKSEYHLSVSADEKATVKNILATKCSVQKN